MGWIYGIPDFLDNYVYFESLNETSHNTPLAAHQKQLLYKKTKKLLKASIGGLINTSSIAKANKFLSSVATNERNKEIQMIESFCRKTGTQFPKLQPYLNNPKIIQSDPEKFYIQLTNAINVARRGVDGYLNELKRIQKNIHEKERTLANYKADDYRYRLVGDISSFLNRLRGNYKDIADTDQFSLQVQNMVMRIIDSSGMLGAITDGETFAAVAASVLADVEYKVQQEMDKYLDDPNQNRDLVIIYDKIASNIEKEYIEKIQKHDKDMTPVQRALSDIGGIDFERLAQNGKEILGLKSLNLSSNALKKHLDKIRKRDARSTNEQIGNIRNILAQNNALKKDLSLLTFSISGTADTKHGSLYELIESSVDNMFGIGRNVNAKSAIDILTMTVNWDISVNDAAMDQFLGSISNAIADSTIQDIETPASLRDIKEQLAAMNAQISDAIAIAEQQQRDYKNLNLDDIFIYHESLKLYSSMETNRGQGSFHGRELGILSYIDYMASSSVSSNSALTIDSNDLAFLGLNLMEGAVASESRGPLERYFSMYAAMLMFDDITNMAIEATNAVKGASGSGSHITQIHLYNLNGIYVPASMLLTQLSNVVTEAGTMIGSGIAAKASIHIPKKNETYEAYLHGERHLTPRLWRDVADEAAENTKVSITFLSSFLSLINSLGSF